MHNQKPRRFLIFLMIGFFNIFCHAQTNNTEHKDESSNKPRIIDLTKISESMFRADDYTAPLHNFGYLYGDDPAL